MNNQQFINSLRQCPFWENSPPEFYDFCLIHGKVRRYAPKQFIYFSGDDSSHVYFLLKGKIRILLTSEFSEKIFRVLRPPAFFPETVFDGKPYPHAALAIDNTEVLSIDRQTFHNFLKDYPELLWNLYRAMSLDLRRAYRQIRNLSLGDARLRLGAKLFALAHAHGESTQDGMLISIPLSATDLAGMCGLARESVSRILGELREVNIIKVDRKKITVLDIEKLRDWIYERSNR